MTTRTVYIAYDGEEFETEEECAAHERCMADLPGILGFNCEGEFQDPKQSDVDRAFNDSEYVFIVDEEEAAKTFEFIKDYYGYEAPEEFHNGDLLHYNGEEDEWENTIDKYISFTERLTTLFESVNAALKDEVCVVNTAMQKIRQAVYELLI